MSKQYLHKAPFIKYVLIWCVVLCGVWWAAVGVTHGLRNAYIYGLGIYITHEGQDSVIMRCLNLGVSSVPLELSFEDKALLIVMERQQPSLSEKIQDIRFTEMLTDPDRSGLCDAYAARARSDNQTTAKEVKAP
ncbi:hypothetical protein [Pseudomonas serbica]|jgi:hypothetical protein|uniref:hypothetical protein n=1 Tax=Pseudomonas serbica TaxID=2965074 RepID=UPI00237A6D97|nr:hypothetical protein [Pseudomonas serbica]